MAQVNSASFIEVHPYYRFPVDCCETLIINASAIQMISVQPGSEYQRSVIFTTLPGVGRVVVRESIQEIRMMLSGIAEHFGVYDGCSPVEQSIEREV